jgi:radical SAM superfamily enzyme YgiQ (UPF0313 family)
MVPHPGPSAVLLAPGYDHGEYLAAESLGLRTVAAVLRQIGVQVDVFDECPVPPPEAVRLLARTATLIGVGVLFTRQTPDAIQLARCLHQDAPEPYYVIGGQGLQFLWEEVMRDCPEFDSACMYEGDEAIAELWARLLIGQHDQGIQGLYTRQDERIVTKGPRPPIVNLDRLPYAYRNSIAGAYRGGHATMSTSRGCAAHCTFCQSGNYANRYHKLPKWRRRSASSIIDEITYLHDTFSIDAISIVDDDFLGGAGQGRERAVEFADRLKRLPFRITYSIECRVDEVDHSLLKLLRDTGLRHVLIGIESATDTDVKLFAKKTTNQQVETVLELLRDLNIDFSIGFIMFQPTSTVTGVAENLNFLARNRIATYRRLVNRLELYPGAPLIQYYERRGVAFYVERYRIYYDFMDPLVSSLHSAMRRLLAPFQDVEVLCEEAKFRAARGHDDGSYRRLALLRSYSDEIATCLVEAAQRCLSEVLEKGPDASFHQVAADVAAQTSRLKNELRLGRHVAAPMTVEDGGDEHEA